MSLYQTLTNQASIVKYELSGNTVDKSFVIQTGFRTDLSFSESIFLHTDSSNHLYISGTGDKISNQDFLIADHGHFIETFALFMNDSNISYNEDNDTGDKDKDTQSNKYNISLFKYVLSNGNIDFNSIKDDIEKLETNLENVTNLVVSQTFKNYFCILYEEHNNHYMKISIDGKTWDDKLSNSKFITGTTELYVNSMKTYMSQNVSGLSNFKETFVLLFGTRRLKEGYAGSSKYYLNICTKPENINTILNPSTDFVEKEIQIDSKSIENRFKYNVELTYNNGNKKIYYDNIVKLFTSSMGIYIYGTFSINYAQNDNILNTTFDNKIYFLPNTKLYEASINNNKFIQINIIKEGESEKFNKVLDLYEYDDDTYVIYTYTTQDILYDSDSTNRSTVTLRENRLVLDNLHIVKLNTFLSNKIAINSDKTRVSIKYDGNSNSNNDIIESILSENVSVTGLDNVIYKTTYITSEYIIIGGKQLPKGFTNHMNSNGVIFVIDRQTSKILNLSITIDNVHSVEHIEYMEHFLFAFTLQYKNADGTIWNSGEIDSIDTILYRSLDGFNWEIFSVIPNFVYSKHKKNFILKKIINPIILQNVQEVLDEKLNKKAHPVVIGANNVGTNNAGDTIPINYNKSYCPVAIGSGALSYPPNNSNVENSICIGKNAGQTNASSNTVCIGHEAGRDNAPKYSIAIGNKAAQTSQIDLVNTIVLNATDNSLNPITSNSLYINPIRIRDDDNTQNVKMLVYDNSTNEIVKSNLYDLSNNKHTFTGDMDISGNTQIMGSNNINQDLGVLGTISVNGDIVMNSNETNVTRIRLNGDNRENVIYYDGSFNIDYAGKPFIQHRLNNTTIQNLHYNIDGNVMTKTKKIEFNNDITVGTTNDHILIEYNNSENIDPVSTLPLPSYVKLNDNIELKTTNEQLVRLDRNGDIIIQNIATTGDSNNINLNTNSVIIGGINGNLKVNNIDSNSPENTLVIGETTENVSIKGGSDNNKIDVLPSSINLTSLNNTSGQKSYITMTPNKVELQSNNSSNISLVDLEARFTNTKTVFNGQLEIDNMGNLQTDDVQIKKDGTITNGIVTIDSNGVIMSNNDTLKIFPNGSIISGNTLFSRSGIFYFEDNDEDLKNNIKETGNPVNNVKILDTPYYTSTRIKLKHFIREEQQGVDLDYSIFSKDEPWKKMIFKPNEPDGFTCSHNFKINHFNVGDLGTITLGTPNDYQGIIFGEYGNGDHKRKDIINTKDYLEIRGGGVFIKDNTNYDNDSFNRDGDATGFWDKHDSFSYNFGDWSQTSIGLFAYGSIVSNKTIVCTNSFSYSDKRIKNDIVDVPDHLALDQVKRIPCRYYGYKEFHKRGTDKTIGYIAQEVKEVLPMAVSTMTKVIPNEYRVIETPLWEEVEDNSGNKKYNLVITDFSDNTYKDDNGNTDISGIKYEFYVTDDLSQNETQIEVFGNSDNRSFTFEKQWNYVFIFGREVNDFLTVDKQKICALHHASIQELDRELETTKNKVTLLETENQTLREKVDSLESKLNSILETLNSNNIK